MREPTPEEIERVRNTFGANDEGWWPLHWATTSLCAFELLVGSLWIVAITLSRVSLAEMFGWVGGLVALVGFAIACTCAMDATFRKRWKR